MKMMYAKMCGCLGLLGIISLLLPQVGLAYEVPSEDSRALFFYVFGPEADRSVGREDSEQTLIIDVPAAQTGPIVIDVYDPDTSGEDDFRAEGSDLFDTVTIFKLLGASLLDEETFAADDETYNRKYFRFGPYDKTQGEKVSGLGGIATLYRFRLQARAVEGNDGNLFNVRVTPDSAEIFSKNITFRLLPRAGDHMYFYPEIPAGTKYIRVGSYDLDREGGSIVLIDRLNQKTYDVLDSTNGRWTETKISFEISTSGRLKISVEKGTQRLGFAGLRVKDDQENLLPLYFKKEPLPIVELPARPTPAVVKYRESVTACRQFTFDARSSYDRDHEGLEYYWEFGDGFTSDEAVVTHAFYDGGSYNVKLMVKDPLGAGETVYQKIEINTPPTVVMEAPQWACVGEEVNYSGLKSSDEETNSLDYVWSFEDGTSAEGVTVIKTFIEAGDHRATLTVDDGQHTPCSLSGATQVIHVNTPPVAKAGSDIAICLTNPRDEYEVFFNAEASYDSDRGDRLTYLWDFGDGSKDEGRRASHVYAAGGSYEARLTVQDNTGSSCSKASDSLKVNLVKVPVAVAGDDRYACVETELNFDASSSYGEGDTNLSFAWDFGDGQQGSGQTVTHTYTEGGDYRVRLTASHGGKGECSQSIDHLRVRVNSQPSVTLKSIKAICTGDKIEFDASEAKDAEGDVLNYTWDFDDGTVVTGGPKVFHHYLEGGVYEVSVTVDDGSGTPCGSSSDSVTVKVNTPPIADAGENSVCCENEQNVFDGSGSSDADGDKLSYFWDFGEGTTSNHWRIAHVYTDPGSYYVRLTVDDGSGTSCSSNTSGFTAKVNAKPVAVIEVSQ